MMMFWHLHSPQIAFLYHLILDHALYHLDYCIFGVLLIHNNRFSNRYISGILHFCTPQHRIVRSLDFGSRGLTCTTLPPLLVHVGLLSKHRPVGHSFGTELGLNGIGSSSP